MPDFSDTERRLIDLLEVGVIIFLPKIWCFQIKVVEDVIETLKRLGGCATFGLLNFINFAA